MFRFLVSVLLVVTFFPKAGVAYGGNKMGIEVEHVIIFLGTYGYKRSFAKDLACYAVARRVIEDGPNRPPTISMNGMIPAGKNTEAMTRLLPERFGVSLTTVSAHDGQASYVLRGPQASVLSSVSIALLWEIYAEASDYDHLWDLVKRSGDELYPLYRSQILSLIQLFNRRYGPHASAVMKLAEKLRKEEGGEDQGGS